MIKLYIYRVTDGCFICEDIGPEQYVTSDITDDRDFTLTPPPDYEHVWRWVEDKWIADEPIKPLIEESQAQVWEVIKAKRLEQITNGVLIESVDKVFHTDSLSAIQYSTIAGMASLGTYQPTPWKVMDNSWVMLTVELLKELQIAMSIKTNSNYGVAEQHKAAMLLVDNPLEYDYSGGWV